MGEVPMTQDAQKYGHFSPPTIQEQGAFYPLAARKKRGILVLVSVYRLSPVSPNGISHRGATNEAGLYDCATYWQDE
jgi:hypothetical protein